MYIDKATIERTLSPVGLMASQKYLIYQQKLVKLQRTLSLNLAYTDKTTSEQALHKVLVVPLFLCV